MKIMKKGKTVFGIKARENKTQRLQKLTFPFRTQSQAFKAAEDRRVKANSLRGDRWTGTWCPAAMQLQCIRVYRSGDQKHRLPTISSIKRDHSFRRAAMITAKFKRS